jgi:hypothetical protein
MGRKATGLEKETAVLPKNDVFGSRGFFVSKAKQWIVRPPMTQLECLPDRTIR